MVLAVGVCGCSVGSSTPLLPFPKSPHPTAPGLFLTHAYLPTTLQPFPVGQRQRGGGGGYPLPLLSKLFRCRVVFVLRTFQLRLGLLCLLLALVLVGQRGCGQREVCTACRRILSEDMRVAASVF
jgi:hypothetical protein